MSDRIRSGIFLYGPRMRYSEVEAAESGLRLRRLGSCEFDFDAERAVLSAEPRKLETIREAISDVFSGSRSVDFSVVLSPASVISFFSPVSDAASEEEKRRQLEADTLLIGGKARALSVVAEPLGGPAVSRPESVTWYHIAAVPAQVRRNVSTILASFSEARHHFMTSMRAAARIAGRLEGMAASAAGGRIAAAVGVFPGLAEIVLVESSRWVIGDSTPSSHPGDVAYAILNMAERANVDVADLSRVYLYGDVEVAADITALRSVVHADVSLLNPVTLFSDGPVEEREGFDPCDYALPVGAAL